MNTVIEQTLRELTLGEAQVFSNLAVLPIVSTGASGPEYITLGVAVREGVLKVEEISESGSVPRVMVTNSGELPVLLLDGEELAGAKQNRVLNATVLLRPMSETSVNVSCTEAGRWSYATREFRDSDVVMARQIRAGKNQSVANSLKASSSYYSDQGEIWRAIDAFSADAGVESRTGAMRDVFEARRETFSSQMAAFPRVEKQTGLAFLIDGAVVGIDFVSRAEAYSDIHDKLLKSFLIDARPSEAESLESPSPHIVTRTIEQILECAELQFASVGLGTDFRLESPDVFGAVLVHEDTCIHAAFFPTTDIEDRGKMRSGRDRRMY